MAIAAARHERLAVTPHQPCVVAGGHCLEPELVGQAHQCRQAARVAAHARVGCLAGQIAGYEGLDHLTSEVLGLVQHTVLHTEVLSRGGGPLQRARRTAAALVVAGP